MKRLRLVGMFLAVFFCILVFGHNLQAHAVTWNPYDVESSVKKNWDSNPCGKQYVMETGRNIVYDIYSEKYDKNGYKIVNKNFGKGKKKYIRFSGWAINFGYKHHTASNNETYIVAQNVNDSSKVKIYGTKQLNLSATEDVEYNKSHSTSTTVWNRCSNTTTNKSNTVCNMEYEKVGFQAYLPIEELFPNIDEANVWRLFLVKRVNSHIVSTPLVVPFEFSDLSYGNGSIELSSGVNARKLIMNSYPTIKRTYPRSNETGSQRGYFEQWQDYKAVTQNEDKTAIWFGVKTGSGTRWASSSYWTFGGDQAKISYKLSKVKVTINHIDKDTKKVLLKETKSIKIGSSYTYKPKKKGYFEDKEGNPYVALDSAKSGKAGSKNINITFKYAKGKPEPDTGGEDGEGGKASGQAFWELRRTDNSVASKIYAQSHFSIAGDHFETRNAKNTLVVGDKTSNDSTAKITSDVEDLNDEDVAYNFTYEYTNFYKDIYTCSESKEGVCLKWKFVERKADWSKGKTFNLAKTLGKSMITIPTNIEQFNVVSASTMDDVLSKKWLVGRSDDWTSGKKKSKNYYEQWQKATDNDVKSDYKLKTQTTLPITPGKLIYSVELPSKTHLDKSFSPLRKEESSGYYMPYDIDESLQNDYTNSTDYDEQDYAIPMQQSAFVDKGTVDGKRVFEMEYVSDLFFMGAYTGYISGYPYAEKVKESIVNSKPLPDYQSIITEGKNKLAEEYTNATGQVYKDKAMFTESSSDFSKLERYAIPISPDSDMKPNETYKNHIALEGMGLNDGILEYDQTFSFEHYLFGDGHDDAWIIEQPDSKVTLSSSDASKVHNITIKNDKKNELIQLIKERPRDKMFKLRWTDLDFADKIKNLIGGF